MAMSDPLQTILRSAATPKTNADVALLGKYARRAADHIDVQAEEIERLKRALSAVDRQLGHDDADDALRDEIDRILKGTK